MPGMNGIELAQGMVSNTPATKVIFMSSSMQPSLSVKNKTKYGRVFIQKPFSGKIDPEKSRQKSAQRVSPEISAVNSRTATSINASILEKWPHPEAGR